MHDQPLFETQFNTYFDEDILPSGQVLIETIGVQDVRSQVEMLLDAKPKTGYSMMATLTGPSGVGKSVTIHEILKEIATRFPRGLPLCLKIKVKPDPTPRQLVEDIVSGLGEKPWRLNTNRFRLADQAAEVIFNNDLRLLVIDNAEQLDAACYEFLHYLYAKTGCAILVVGLKPILQVIRDHQKFDNRAPLRIDFAVPTEEEILTLVLPHLSIPFWTFDPTSEKDQALGRKLWSSVTPSLRSLRAVLQNACLLADAEGTNTITHEMVRMGFQMTGLRRRPGGLEEDDQEEEHQETQTEYEDDSVRRQREKKKDQEDRYEESRGYSL